MITIRTPVLIPPPSSPDRSLGGAGAGVGEAAALSYRVALDDSLGLVINEVMAANAQAVEDPHGDFDDWIELHNTSDEVIELSGFSLTDKESKLDKWTSPSGTTIEPQGYLLVWADEDGKQDHGLHANFKLSKSGETLVLSNADGAVVDRVAFEALADDEAYVRQSDGQWTVEAKSSPGEANGH